MAWTASAVGALSITLIAVLATRQPVTEQPVQTPLLGNPAPAINGTTLTGTHFKLSSLKGRWVVVNFFASWCPPCRQEQPQLVRFAAGAGSSPRAQAGSQSRAQLVSVVFNDTSSAAAAFLGPSLGRWPQVTDPGGRIALHYGVSGPPETFIVDPNGFVRAKLDGPVTASALDRLLARLKSPAPAGTGS